MLQPDFRDVELVLRSARDFTNIVGRSQNIIDSIMQLLGVQPDENDGDNRDDNENPSEDAQANDDQNQENQANENQNVQPDQPPAADPNGNDVDVDVVALDVENQPDQQPAAVPHGDGDADELRRQRRIRRRRRRFQAELNLLVMQYYRRDH